MELIERQCSSVGSIIFEDVTTLVAILRAEWEGEVRTGQIAKQTATHP